MTFTYYDGTRNYKTVKAFEGVIGNIERRWRETDSDWVREELERYQGAHPCETCGGYRLKPQALAVKVGGKHIGEVTDMSIKAANALVRRAAEDVHQAADRDRHAHPEGDPRAAAVPQRRRPRIPDAVARRRHAVGRRIPAHPPRLADRLRPHRRAVRARRAVHRPAPARQRPPAATLKHLRDIGNTVIVVEHDEDAILQADYVVDIGPGAGIHGGEIIAQGHARRHHGQPDKPHRAIPLRHAADPAADQAARARRRARRSASSAPPRTTCRTSPPRSRSASSPASPASPAPASRR